MRIAIIIAILLLALIGANSQGFHFSPEYYPVESVDLQTSFVVDRKCIYKPYEGRGTWFQRNRRPIAIIAYHVGTIGLGALSEGLRDNGNKEWSHAFRAAEIGALVAGPFIHNIKRSDWAWYILDYGFLRLATFDAFYNGVTGRPVLDNGTTSLYDNTMSSMTDQGKVWVKTWSLTLGFAIAFGELKGTRKKVKTKNCKIKY